MLPFLTKIFLISLLLIGNTYGQREDIWQEQSSSPILRKVEKSKEIFLSSTSWHTCQWVHYLHGETSASLMKIPKGERPAPSSYLCPNDIAVHLSTFLKGASYIVPEDVLDKYGRALVGRPDNCQFVIPKEQMDCLLEEAKGNVSYIEAALGVPQGHWAGRRLSRIDIPHPENFHLRMPSGNEQGVNDLWLPGGYLWQGYREAIISQVPQGAYVETRIMFNTKINNE